MNSSFDLPPQSLCLLVAIGGVATAILLIVGLELGATHLRKAGIATETTPTVIPGRDTRPSLPDRQI